MQEPKRGRRRSWKGKQGLSPDQPNSELLSDYCSDTQFDKRSSECLFSDLMTSNAFTTGQKVKELTKAEEATSAEESSVGD